MSKLKENEIKEVEKFANFLIEQEEAPTQEDLAAIEKGDIELKNKQTISINVYRQKRSI